MALDPVPPESRSLPSASSRPASAGAERATDRRGCPVPVLSPEELHREAVRAFRVGNRGRLAHARALVAIDETRAHLGLGYSSLVAYARAEFGWGRTTTLDAVRTARALEELPRLRGAFVAGQLCWSALVEITRVATPATEEDWLRYVKGKDVPAVAEAVRRAVRDGKASPPEGSWGLPDLDRRVVLRFRGSEFEKLRRALEPLAHELAERLGRRARLEEVLLQVAEMLLGRWAEGREAEGLPEARYAVVYLECPSCGRTAMQTDRGPLEVDPEQVGRVRGDADVVDLSGNPDGEQDGAPGGSREETSRGNGGGNPVSAAESAAAQGPVRKSGRPSRATAVRRRVFLRDGERCANPACDRRAEHWHHVVPRAQGGPDTLENGVALCAVCHAMVHAGHLEVRRARDGRLVFRPRAASIPVPDARPLEREVRRLPVLRLVRKSGRETGLPRPPEDRATGPAPASGFPDDAYVRDLAAGLRRLGWRAREAEERIRAVILELGPERSRDEAAVLKAALRTGSPQYRRRE